MTGTGLGGGCVGIAGELLPYQAQEVACNPEQRWTVRRELQDSHLPAGRWRLTQSSARRTDGSQEVGG